MGRLASLRHAVSAGARLPGGYPLGRPRRRRGRREKGDLETELIPLSVPEVRRLVLAMAAGSSRERNFRLGWSLWRRAHQAVAARCKKATRAARDVFRRGESPEERTAPKVGVLPPEGAAPLTVEEWEMLGPRIPHKPPAGRPYHDHRTVLGGILWVARTGSSWREMPSVKSSASGRPLTGATSCG